MKSLKILKVPCNYIYSKNKSLKFPMKPYTFAINPKEMLGLGLMSQCFTSPNKKGDISSPTDICCGDVKQIPKARDINPNP